MDTLLFTDIINNMIDEIERAHNILIDDEYAIGDMLISDMADDLDRSYRITERIEYALVIAAYVGEINGKNGNKYDIDFHEWRKKYIEYASNHSFIYDDDGRIVTDIMYEDAASDAKRIISEMT